MSVMLKFTLEEVSDEDYIEYATYPINISIENEVEVIETVNYQWKIHYKIVDEPDSEKVEIFVEFDSRYLFDENITLITTVIVAGEEIERKFELEKMTREKFEVDLEQISNTQIDNKDIKVNCILRFIVPNIMRKYFQTETKLRGTDALFTNSNFQHDIILLVGNEKFFVLKKHLAFFSQYFTHFFYFIDTDKKEFKIQDVEARQFQQLLCIIHPHTKFSIDDDNVLYLLELAARFEMPSVIAACGTYLSDFDNNLSVSLMQRLELSNEHNISHLQAKILKKLRDMNSVEYKLFVEKNRDRIRKLGGGSLKNLI